MINAIYFYRAARFFYKYRLTLISKFITLFIFLIYNSKISYKTSIGAGSFCVYGGIGVLINEDASIGRNCSIGVNSMVVGQGPYKHAPKIGDKVFIGPGAVIQGPIIIEDGVIIAPNAVVNRSVPEGAIVAGVPAKIVGWVKDLDYDIFKNEAFKDGYFSFMTETDN